MRKSLFFSVLVTGYDIMEGEEGLARVYDRARRLLATNLSSTSLMDDEERVMDVIGVDSNFRSATSSERSLSQSAFSSRQDSIYPSEYGNTRHGGEEDRSDIYSNSDGLRMIEYRQSLDDADNKSSVTYARSNVSYEAESRTETLRALTEQSTPRNPEHQATRAAIPSPFAQSLKCADHLVNKVTAMLERHRPTAITAKTYTALREEIFEFLSELAVDALALRWRIVTDVKVAETAGPDATRNAAALLTKEHELSSPRGDGGGGAARAAGVARAPAPRGGGGPLDAPHGPRNASAQRAERGPAAAERRTRELAKQVLQLQVASVFVG
jgi:hypothetical protein